MPKMPSFQQLKEITKSENFVQNLVAELQEKYAEIFQTMLGETAKLEGYHRDIFNRNTSQLSEDILELAQKNKEKSDSAFWEINEYTNVVFRILSDFSYFNNTETPNFFTKALREHTDRCERNLELLRSLTIEAEKLLELVKDDPGTSREDVKPSIPRLISVKIENPSSEIEEVEEEELKGLKLIQKKLATLEAKNEKLESKLKNAEYDKALLAKNQMLRFEAEKVDLEAENWRLLSKIKDLENLLEHEKECSSIMRQANADLEFQNACLLEKIQTYERISKSSSPVFTSNLSTAHVFPSPEGST